MTKLDNQFKAILAGMMIGVSSIIYCMTYHISTILGAFLFSNGLLAVIVQQYNLYTGKIGYINRSTIWDMPLMLMYNILGVILVCVPFFFTRSGDMAIETAQMLVASKMSDGYGSLFLLGIGCGMMMYLAVDNFRKHNNPLFVIIPVMFFILCGFEHCIADVGYIMLAKVGDTFDAWLRILVIAAGNAAGSIILYRFNNLNFNHK